MNLDIWSQNYLTAYTQAVQVDLPEVSGFRAQKDLLRAIKAADQSWAGNLGRDLFRAENNWRPGQAVPAEMDVQSILSEFLQYYRNTKISSILNVNNGAFCRYAWWRRTTKPIPTKSQTEETVEAVSLWRYALLGPVSLHRSKRTRQQLQIRTKETRQSGKRQAKSIH